jgi:hypothetical protein
MTGTTLAFLEEQIELSEQLIAGRGQMNNPQDLPGRYGRVVKAVDHLLEVMQCVAVLGGGWAVWHHGYSERVTQDLDVALPASRIDEFLRVASLAGFQLLPKRKGRWPKLIHKESGVTVDILPEGARPGTLSKPAPTTIPPPGEMGAAGSKLCYMTLESLLELKLAAGREKDFADVVALLKVNMDRIKNLRQHVAKAHKAYAQLFDRLLESAKEQQDE